MQEHRIRSQIERFADALAIAVYDRELETWGLSINYYFDADVVYLTVLGFEAEGIGPIVSDDVLLVRSLLSCGFLGDFCMLRPHAYELLDLLRRRKADYSRPEELSKLQNKARTFLEGKGICHILEELHEVVTAEDPVRFPTDQARVDEFLTTLQRQPGEVFARIEQASGGWWDRLTRYKESERIHYELEGPHVQELLSDYEQDLNMYYKSMLAKRKKRTLSAFEDAVALTILRARIKARDAGKDKPIVRFYTETPAVRKPILQKKTLRNSLSYENLPPSDRGSTLDDARLVLRNSQYFILRAVYEALAIHGAASDSDLDDFKILLRELQDLLASEDDQLENMVSQLTFQDRSLMEHIADFENLQITDRVWARQGVPDEFHELDYLHQWTDVFDFARNKLTQTLLTRLDNARRLVSEDIFRMGTRKREYRTVLAGTTLRRSRTKGRIRDPMRDLGLVRWGYELTAAEKQEVLEQLHKLVEEDNAGLLAEIENVVGSIQAAKQDIRKCQTTCAILWGVSCFDQIVSLVDEYRDRHPVERLPPSLLVIREAAQARATEGRTRKDRKRVVSRVLTFYEKAPPEQKTGMLLGVGYVLYHAWDKQRIADNIRPWQVESLDSEVQSWAQESFRLATKAYEDMPTGTLAWAYSVNHCAYVGMCADLKEVNITDYILTLVDLEDVPEVWNARFADTLGMYYLIQAERKWYGRQAEDHVPRDLDEYLASADEYFKMAEDLDIGDIDLRKHKIRRDELARVYTQAKEESSDPGTPEPEGPKASTD